MASTRMRLQPEKSARFIITRSLVHGQYLTRDIFYFFPLSSSRFLIYCVPYLASTLSGQKPAVIAFTPVAGATNLFGKHSHPLQPAHATPSTLANEKSQEGGKNTRNGSSFSEETEPECVPVQDEQDRGDIQNHQRKPTTQRNLSGHCLATDFHT